jgi:hypothetical protein
MSHLLDSPLARMEPRLDITDVYVFRGRHGTVVVIGVNNSASGADALPGFSPYAHYDFRIDTNGDAIEDLTYRVIFGPQHYEVELRVLQASDARVHTAPGTLLAWGSSDTVLTGLADCSYGPGWPPSRSTSNPPCRKPYARRCAPDVRSICPPGTRRVLSTSLSRS